jgi:hypothetical protein
VSSIERRGAEPFLPGEPQKGGTGKKIHVIRRYGYEHVSTESEKSMTRKREPLKKPVHIADVLKNALTAYRAEGDTELMKVWSLWKGVVGHGIAENTRASAFKGNLLIVHVSSSAWIHHLHFLKQELISKLNDALGKDLVGDIKFKIGPL